MKPKQKITKKD